MNRDESHHISLISDSLLGVAYNLPDPKRMIFPFLDNLQLLHQGQSVFAIWEKDKLIYTSLKDKDYVDRHNIVWGSPVTNTVSLGGLHHMSIHRFSETCNSDANSQHRLPVDQRAMELSSHLLAADDIRKSNVIEMISQSINSHVDNECSSSSGDDFASASELEYAKVKEFLKPVRAALNDIFTEVVSSEKWNIRGRMGSVLPNIFPVVRTAPLSCLRRNGHFDYTAGLLPLPAMEQQLAKWCVSNKERTVSEVKESLELLMVRGVNGVDWDLTDPVACLNALQEPLGPHARSVSDLVFTSGLVSFGHHAQERGVDESTRGDKAGDVGDRRRRAMELLLYPKSRSIFYIPVHVGGTPWLSFFTFAPDPVEAWYHNYSFYRDIVPKTLALLRQRAQEAYAGLLTTALLEAIADRTADLKSIVSRINEETQKLARVYPFSLCRAKESSNNESNAMILPGRGGQLTLQFKPNPFLHQQTTWDLGNTDNLHRHCVDHITKYIEREQSMELSVVAQSTHLLKVPLDTLSGMVRSKSPNRQTHMERLIKKLHNLHDFSAICVSESKRRVLLTKWKQLGAANDLVSFVMSTYAEMLTYLCDPFSSGLLAPLTKNLMNSGCIHFNEKPGLTAASHERFTYFEPHVEAVLDGLLTNALNGVSSADSPNVCVDLVREPRMAEPDGLYLIISNSSAMSVEGLTFQAQHWNSPGSDMIGISALHWVSRKCWPKDADRLLWSIQHEPVRVVARALIAEVA